MISVKDNNSSSSEEDNEEFQRLKDAAVTLEPDGDLHANNRLLANSSAENTNENNPVVSESRKSSRPSLRPKQTYFSDPSELKMTTGFKTHVAKKLSEILDKELEFLSESVVDQNNKDKSCDSGIRLLSSSKNFLHMDLSKWNTVSRPKSHTKHANSTKDKNVNSTNRKRVKQSISSSESSDDEKLTEAAVSFEDIKQRDELLSSFATPSTPILVIQESKDEAQLKKVGMKSNTEAEASENESQVKKKKKHCKERKENLFKEENEDKEKELSEKDKRNKLCTENNLTEKK